MHQLNDYHWKIQSGFDFKRKVPLPRWDVVVLYGFGQDDAHDGRGADGGDDEQLSGQREQHKGPLQVRSTVPS